MKRKMLAFLLTLCMLLGMVPATAFAEEVLPGPPNADVKSLGITILNEYCVFPEWNTKRNDNPFTLPIAMSFAAMDTDETVQTNAYKDYIADFYIEFDELSGDSLDKTDCYLAGEYGSFGWILIPLEFFGEDLIVFEDVKYPVTSTIFDWLTYEAICTQVKVFNCGIYIPEETIENNPNMQITLSLALSETLDKARSAKYDLLVGEPYTYTVADLLGKYITVIDKENKIERFETLEDALPTIKDGDTIELLTDAAITTPIEVTGDLTIKSNGCSLTSSAQQAIIVKASNAALTLDGVNVTAMNNAIRVVESAEGAVINVSGSALTGLSVVNVRAPRSRVTITGGSIICDDQTEAENYGALTIAPTAVNASIIASDVEFIISGDSFKALNIADGGVIKIDGSEEEVEKGAAIIEYGNGAIYSFFTLQEAINYAKTGETVKLICDIELNDDLTIDGNKILDVNGKNLTGKIKLLEGASLKAASGLNVITNVAGKVVSYNGTAYVLVDGYEVTFNSNSGSAVDAMTVVSGAAVSAPANPTRSGYTFGGWYTDEACTSEYNFEALVTGDITLYAKWTKNQTSRPSSKPSSKPTTPAEPTISTDNKTEENAAGDQVTTTETTVKPEITVTGGTAKTEISESAANKIVETATKSESSSVVITPEVDETKDVDKVEVTIAASTVEKIGTETDANLTVSTPVADVEIANAGLNDLAKEGEKVTVSAEKKDDTIVVEVKADNKNVDKVSGGLTVTIPQEEVSAGTVAVIVHEDGTEEIVRQTVGGENALTIPLDGSATIKIVDNSKDFDDVEDTDWHSDAVDFAASRELFNGTSKTTFSPSGDMTRGMLAMVLHNLENNPESETENGFDDVQDSKYYAGAVSWAAEKGLVSGYANGGFGPEDKITREQLAVILWKYAGCPESDHELDFEDEANIAGYAKAALQWANEHKIINGKGSGKLDPAGNATRAEVAQMLKNFMENTKK